jgi:hypothetical protein
MIETDPQALGPQGVGDLPYQIAVEQVAGIVVGEFGVVQGEALVVLGGEHHILAAGLFGELGPGAGEAGLGLEFRHCLRGVGVGVRAHPLLDPFEPAGVADHPAVPIAGQTRVEPPMDEHPEARLAPPAHPLVACGGGFRGGGEVGGKCGQGECGG